jgi:hypothetical protein
VVLCNAASYERDKALQKDKISKIESRLKRVEDFIKYLSDEEASERAEYLLDPNDDIMGPIWLSFQNEKVKVMSSAKRNFKTQSPS